MTVSPEEALGLLSKWASESANVYVFVQGDALVVRLLGLLSIVLDPPCFVVAQPCSPSRRTDIAFGLGAASGFDYRDMREAPAAIKGEMGEWIIGGLSFTLGTMKVQIYELADGTS